MAAYPFSDFKKLDAVNPILKPREDTWFVCPYAGRVAWEAKDVFNPAAVVHRGRVALLYRAEDNVGRYLGTSRIGLAWSTDGIHFEREPRPVLFPGLDRWARYEWEGGCEDPRIVKLPSGAYLLTYTMYDGMVARLATASSRDLWSWEKYGPAFPKTPDLWSKAGAIVVKDTPDGLEAALINGRLWMYWGESSIFLASSRDGEHWEILCDNDGEPKALLSVRPGHLDSNLVEPGPPALLTPKGIILSYHGKNHSDPGGDPKFPAGAYSSFTATFDPTDPARLVHRDDAPWFMPDRPGECEGQVGHVCFVEGMVRFDRKWLAYYGTADSSIAVAEAPVK